MWSQPIVALLVALAVLASCVPPPGNEPLTPREKREAIEDSLVTQKVREDADKRSDGVCGTVTGPNGVQRRGDRGIGPPPDRPHVEACPH
jgi:hypothetical protein